jgi:hypothetical protein
MAFVSVGAEKSLEVWPTMSVRTIKADSFARLSELDDNGFAQRLEKAFAALAYISRVGTNYIASVKGN